MIERLSLRNFCSHKETDIILTPGITLIVGDNGAGKSALVEAIVWALYGRPLRAQRDWTPVRDGSAVDVCFTDVCIERSATGRGSKASLSPSVVRGTRDVNAWVTENFGQKRALIASRIFHRGTLSRFTLAGDATRKQVIEEILGADTFDAALELVAQEHRDVKAELDVLSADLSRAEHAVDLSREAVKAREHIKASYRDNFADRIASAKEQIAALGVAPQAPERPKVRHSARDRLLALQGELGAKESAYRKAQRLIASGKCPTCGQPTRHIHTPRADTESLRREVARWKRLVDQEIEDNNADFAEFERLSSDYRKWCGEYDYFKSKVSLLEDQRKDQRVHYDRAKRLLRQHQKTLEEKKAEARRLRAEHTSLARREARLQDLRYIYGPRGARVMLLRDALEAISLSATDVLRGVRGSGSVEIAPDSKMQSISVFADVGHGSTSYRGLSQGEGGIVDFALLKALSAIAGVAPLAVEMPLIYDDVLDALDVSVQGGVAEYLTEEAGEGQVLVLTHDMRALDMFPDARVLTVKDGQVSG